VERYRTIVADPPWDHSDGTGVTLTHGDKTKRRQRADGAVATTLPYASMTLDDICALPVAGLAERDAHLYLWTTNRYLRSAWDIAEAWGFTGSCVLTWCKAPAGFGVGGTFKSTTEFCLFARRGSLASLRDVDTRWFTWPRRCGPSVAFGQRRNALHSAKPEAFLDMVESVSPGPYVELFARRNRLGWDTWGDEALEHVEFA
jgi:N6-adenosine-specific RNA methylase IME4